MSTSLVHVLGRVGAWGAVLTATLSIARWPGEWGHGICGPWGCGPPVQALVACHLSWLVVLVPLAWILRTRLTVRWRRLLGVVAIACACLGLIGMASYERATWWSAASDWQRPFFPQRVGFAVVTQVDLPLLELVPAGVLLIAGRRRTPQKLGADRVPGEGRDILLTRA